MQQARRASLRLNAGVLNHLRPLAELQLDKVAELGRRRRKAVEADIAEFLLGRRVVDDLADRAVELGDDSGRRAGGRYESGPGVELKAFQPRLVERRQIREQR